ncbi:hypothetical protein FHR84_000775 [Actinopolyspora biskrensis]|uniref:Transketolase, C-terminal domain n=1 Tax=Actinopolyspora biskrensis TaxID=1470178 RepID=A0A852YRW0_9ACTN|nr:transketolase C-terminal domain-containing protein [Actinopolyspora biskrensis]NYH77461.1 hypothetical protein [Actinopolyspora biskrensis]
MSPVSRPNRSRPKSPGHNVNIAGGLPGLTTGYGPSHQATEDVAVLRALPGLTIVDPGGSVDTEQAVPVMAADSGPTYLRLLRGRLPPVLDEYDYRFELGKAKRLRDGGDAVLVSSGLMTMRALEAAEELSEHNVDVAVVHRSTVKPLDEATLLHEADSDRLLVTLENHSLVGGLAEPVASALVRNNAARVWCRSGCRTSSSKPVRCRRRTSTTACRRIGWFAVCSTGWARSKGRRSSARPVAVRPRASRSGGAGRRGPRGGCAECAQPTMGRSSGRS